MQFNYVNGDAVPFEVEIQRLNAAIRGRLYP
jgi:hypothetical protein